MEKFFLNPFGVSGDQTAIPDSTQTDGSVSFEQGFGYDYSRDLSSDADAKAIPRHQTNYLFYAITKALREYQTYGTPDYITASQNGGSAYSYSKYARVVYSGSVYVSLKDNNTDLPTVAASWCEIPGVVSTTLQATTGTDDTTIMTPVKVAAAIAALAPSPTIATQAEAEAGTNNSKMMTPLRVAQAIAAQAQDTVSSVIAAVATAAGFAHSFTANGYIKFPSWLGGIIFQWGAAYSGTTSAGTTVAYPVAFPNVTWQCLASDSGVTCASFGTVSINNSVFTLIGRDVTGNYNAYLCRFWAIGR